MTLWERVEELAKRVGELEARLPKQPAVVTEAIACQLDCEQQGTHRECAIHMGRAPARSCDREHLSAEAVDPHIEAIKRGLIPPPVPVVALSLHQERLDHLEEWKRRAEKAEAELRRLGHGEEVVFVFGDDGQPKFTTRVGDLAWDTRQNRARTFDYIERAHQASLARARVAMKGP